MRRDKFLTKTERLIDMLNKKHIKVVTGTSACTDGVGTIELPPLPEDATEKDYRKYLNLGGHEQAHFYGDSSSIPLNKNKIIGGLENFVEDHRCEHLQEKEFPGFRAEREVFYGDIIEEQRDRYKNASKKDMSTFIHCLGGLLYLNTRKKDLDASWDIEASQELMDAYNKYFRKRLPDMLKVKTRIDASVLSEKLYEDIKDLIKDQDQKNQDSGDDQDDPSNDQDSGDDQDDQSNDQDNEDDDDQDSDDDQSNDQDSDDDQGNDQDSGDDQSNDQDNEDDGDQEDQENQEDQDDQGSGDDQSNDQDNKDGDDQDSDDDQDDQKNQGNEDGDDQSNDQDSDDDQSNDQDNEDDDDQKNQGNDQGNEEGDDQSNDQDSEDDEDQSNDQGNEDGEDQSNDQDSEVEEILRKIEEDYNPEDIYEGIREEINSNTNRQYLVDKDVKDVIMYNTEVSQYEAQEALKAGLDTLGLAGKRMTKLFVSQTKPHILRNQYEGRLDVRNFLSDSSDKRSDVFNNKIRGTLDKAAASFVIDNSGSMTGSIKNVYSILMGILHILNKAMIPTEAMGFTSTSNYNRDNIRSYPVVTSVIKRFNEPWNMKTMKRCVCTSKLEYTVILDTVKIAAQSLYQRPEGNKILFVLSDGKTESGNSLFDMICHRAYIEYLDLCRKAGIKVFGIGLDTDISDAFGKDWISVDTSDLGAKLTVKLEQLLLRKD